MGSWWDACESRSNLKVLSICFFLAHVVRHEVSLAYAAHMLVDKPAGNGLDDGCFVREGELENLIV